MGVGEKNELLFQGGINFNDLPAWQKRGVGVYWVEYKKEAVNPKTGEGVSATRRRLKRDLELARGEEYDGLILGLIGGASP
jgi:tRNA(His) 5'-end guanylyltransferase